MFRQTGGGVSAPRPLFLENAMQIRTDKDRAKARVYYKARRRGLLFRVRRPPKRGNWRFTVIREDDGLMVWAADYLDEVEEYLDKATPREWRD
jgi:hypothetical protein